MSTETEQIHILNWPTDSTLSLLSPHLSAKPSSEFEVKSMEMISSSDSFVNLCAENLNDKKEITVRNEVTDSLGSSTHSFCESVESSTDDTPVSCMPIESENLSIDEEVLDIPSIPALVDNWIFLNILLLGLAVAFDFKFFRGLIEPFLHMEKSAMSAELAITESAIESKIEIPTSLEEVQLEPFSSSNSMVVYMSRALSRMHNGRELFEFVNLYLGLFRAQMIEVLVKSAQVMADVKIGAEQALHQAMSFKEGLLLYIALFSICFVIGLLGNKAVEMSRARRVV